MKAKIFLKSGSTITVEDIKDVKIKYDTTNGNLIEYDFTYHDNLTKKISPLYINFHEVEAIITEDVLPHRTRQAVLADREVSQ